MRSGISLIAWLWRTLTVADDGWRAWSGSERGRGGGHRETVDEMGGPQCSCQQYWSTTSLYVLI